MFFITIAANTAASAAAATHEARRAQIADQEDSILSHQEHVAILAAKTVESR